MQRIILIVFLLAISVSAKPAETNLKEEANEIQEIFCLDKVKLYFISKEKSVTSTTGDNRLRVLHLPDGKLLIQVEEQRLIYPLMPNVTPVVLGENGAVILPDLQTKGAAIALRLPVGVDNVLYNILHKVGGSPSVSEATGPMLNDAQGGVGTMAANMLANNLVYNAEQISRFIEIKAASLQANHPAYQGKPGLVKTGIVTGAKGVKFVTGKVANVTGFTVNLIDRAQVGVGNLVGPQIHAGTAKLIKVLKRGNTEKPPQPSSNKMTVENLGAIQKVTEALQQSADILTKSIRENSVQVVHHRYGEQMGNAMIDTVNSAVNTGKAFLHVKSLNPTYMALNTAFHIATATVGSGNNKDPDPKSTRFTCTD